MITATGSGAGTVSAKYEYYPFGGLLTATGTAATGNPFRFSTKYRDNETGCYYYGYRYLRTKHGRWLSRDPIGEDGGENLYASMMNGPTMTFDPMGRSCCCCPTSISLDNIEPKDGWWGTGRMDGYGFNFEVNVDLSYKCTPGDTQGGDCTVIWSEKLNKPPTFITGRIQENGSM